MKCLMDKSREVSYPCSSACHLFGDCVVEFEIERSAGGMGGHGSSSPSGHGHSVEGIVVLERQDYNFITNGDHVRAMCDGELAELFASKVIDHVALMAVEAARPISGVSLAAMKATYRQLFFSWLRSPAEEGGK